MVTATASRVDAQRSLPPAEHIPDLLATVAADLKTIARDEVELARLELEKTTRVAAAEAAVVIIGGFVAMIGLGFACAAAVDALGAVIPPLWARLLVMAGVYVGLGVALVAVFAKRLKRDAVPDLAVPEDEAKQTVDEVKQGLTH